MARSLVVALVLVVTLPLAASASAQTATPIAPTLAELIARIDAEPDILHNDYTPAVWAICAHGLRGAAAVVQLLDAPDEMTRTHASRALSCAVSTWFGWAPGRGYPSGSRGEARFDAAWTANGAYAWDGDASARHASAQAWQQWIATHLAAPPPPDEPSTDSIRAAVEPVMPTVRACGTGDARVFAELTFVHTGALSRVRIRGARGAVATCMERALHDVRIAPFRQARHTLAVGIRP